MSQDDFDEQLKEEDQERTAVGVRPWWTVDRRGTREGGYDYAWFLRIDCVGFRAQNTLEKAKSANAKNMKTS